MTFNFISTVVTITKQYTLTFHHIAKLEIHMNKCIPLKGNSDIPLPAKLANEKAIINIRNEGN